MNWMKIEIQWKLNWMRLIWISIVSTYTYVVLQYSMLSYTWFGALCSYTMIMYSWVENFVIKIVCLHLWWMWMWNMGNFSVFPFVISIQVVLSTVMVQRCHTLVIHLNQILHPYYSACVVIYVRALHFTLFAYSIVTRSRLSIVQFWCLICVIPLSNRVINFSWFNPFDNHNPLSA